MFQIIECNYAKRQHLITMLIIYQIIIRDLTIKYNLIPAFKRIYYLTNYKIYPN